MACHIQLFFLHIRKKIVFTLVNKEVRSNNMWGIQCNCVVTDVLFTVVEGKNGITIDDCDFYVLLSTPYSPRTPCGLLPGFYVLLSVPYNP
jgi:hypothetical protein